MHTRDRRPRGTTYSRKSRALWTALPGFRGDSSERTWLYRVAHNTAVRFTTKRTRRARHEQPNDAPEPISDTNPESAAIERQQRQLLWEAVHELPILDRQLVVLHLEGLSAADITGITGLSAANVATRLTRTRKKLIATIRQEERR